MYLIFHDLPLVFEFLHLWTISWLISIRDSSQIYDSKKTAKQINRRKNVTFHVFRTCDLSCEMKNGCQFLQNFWKVHSFTPHLASLNQIMDKICKHINFDLIAVFNWILTQRPNSNGQP